MVHQRSALKSTGAPPPASEQLRRKIQLRHLASEEQSTRLPEFAFAELHLVRWKSSWTAGVAELRAVGARLATIVDDVVFDRGALPISSQPEPVAAIRGDVLTTDEEAFLLTGGWSLVGVVRLATAAFGDSEQERIHEVKRRASTRLWTYYRSEGWAFIYPRAGRRR